MQGNIAARNMQPPPDLSAQDTVNPTTSSDALMSDTNRQLGPSMQDQQIKGSPK